MSYGHILAAVDDSVEAEDVLEVAAEIARVHGARLSMLSVVPPINQVYSGFDISSIVSSGVAFEIEAQADRTLKLKGLAPRFGASPDDVQAQIGYPSRVIRETAEALGVDLIVIGSHGRHGLGLLLGSTANGVLHGAPCDVYVVRIRTDE